MEELNISESEIPPKQIFIKMKSNIYDEFYTLKYSKINNNAYIYSRKTLFHILHKITNAMGFKSQTFFLCAHYLDVIFSSNKSINININLLGLSSLCLSAKYCENDPEVPHLQYFIKIYNILMGYKNFLSMNDLKIGEVSALKLLNYKLNYFTVYDFNSFFFAHGILKLEQIKEIGIYKNKNNKNDFYIKQINSLMIKNILEKIYKKSRYYLDIVVNKTRLCFKYNSLYLSILIMKKSVNEVLSNEKNIYLYDINEQIEFYKRNSMCFKEIMSDFYNIEYENNEQYKKLIKDEEIKEIFEEKEKKRIENYQNFTKKKEEKKEEEKENNYRLNKSKSKRDNKKIFNSSVSNGFYKRLEINEDEINKKERKLRMETSRKERIEKNNNKSKDKTSDNIHIDFNINEFRNQYRKLKTMRNKLKNGNKSDYNILLRNREEKGKEKEEKEKEKKEENITKRKRYIPRIETFNNFNCRNTISNLKSSEKACHISNYYINKNKEDSSPIEYNDKFNNYSNYSRMNKFIKIKELNNCKEKKDYSFSITENYNNNEHKKSCDKKLYFRKYLNQNNNIDNYTSSLNFNSTNNINLNESKNKMNSINIEESSNRKRNLIINKYYTRINLKIPNNDKNLLNTSINLGNENTFRNNNTINVNDNNNNNIITSSTRYRRRRLYNGIGIKRKNNEDISGDNIKEYNTINNNKNVIESYISKTIYDNKNEIDSYNIKNEKKGLTSLDFFRNNSNVNKISVNTIKNNNDINKSFIDENKNKIKYLLGKQNSQLNNTLKEINIAYTKNINEERNNFEKSKEKIIINKDKENNNILEKNNSIKDNIKINYTKSIRQKYLNNNKNNKKNKNNIDDNEKTKEDKNIIIKNEYSTVKSRYFSRNKNNIKKNNYNVKEDNNNNSLNKNNERTKEKEKEKEDNNEDKNKIKCSYYKIINKTKSFYKINNNEGNSKKNELEEYEKNKNENLKSNKNQNLNFYKSSNNFYRTEKNYEEQRNKEEIIKNQQDKKIGNNSYLRNIIYKNKINKNNINLRYKNENSVNNDIIINEENENNNNYYSNEYFKHRNIYRKSNIPTSSNINSSFINSSKDNSIFLNKKKNATIVKNENNRATINNNLISKFHFYRKTINKDSYNKNYHTIINK